MFNFKFINVKNIKIILHIIGSFQIGIFKLQKISVFFIKNLTNFYAAFFKYFQNQPFFTMVNYNILLCITLKHLTTMYYIKLPCTYTAVIYIFYCIISHTSIYSVTYVALIFKWFLFHPTHFRLSVLKGQNPWFLFLWNKSYLLMLYRITSLRKKCLATVFNGGFKLFF